MEYSEAFEKALNCVKTELEETGRNIHLDADTVCYLGARAQTIIIRNTKYKTIAILRSCTSGAMDKCLEIMDAFEKRPEDTELRASNLIKSYLETMPLEKAWVNMNDMIFKCSTYEEVTEYLYEKMSNGCDWH